jgi:hypothetical protein
MLLRLADSLSRLGRHAEALEIHAYAETISQDACAPLHALWLAAEGAVAGRIAVARARLQRVSVAQIAYDHRLLHTLVEAIVRLEQPLAGKRRRLAYRELRQGLEETLRPHRNVLLADERLRRCYVRWLQRVVRERGGLLARLWLAIRLAWQKHSP